MASPAEVQAFEHLCRSLLPRIPGFDDLTFEEIGGIWSMFDPRANTRQSSSASFWAQAAADIAVRFDGQVDAVRNVECRVYPSIYGPIYWFAGTRDEHHVIETDRVYAYRSGRQSPRIACHGDPHELALRYLEFRNLAPSPPRPPPASDEEIEAAFLEADAEIKRTIRSL